tara:strand:+ start:2146 stop:2610 length:465 start_codon:yes stop_codon:yes gene_type:complete
MIANKSRQTSALTTLKVQEDLTRKGWVVMRSEEECPYDLIVDMGIENGKRVFRTIQVKNDPRTSSRPNPDKSNEPVSRGGKNRNSYWYYDEDIDYIASLDLQGEVVYWNKEVYRKLSPSKLKKKPPSHFPENFKMFTYRKNTEIEYSNIEKFYT